MEATIEVCGKTELCGKGERCGKKGGKKSGPKKDCCGKPPGMRCKRCPLRARGCG